MMTVAALQAFERDIADAFSAGEIRAPIHLSGGNEEQLIRIFDEGVDNELDWVCSSWRSHYHCLLKGVPSEKLRADILAGKSITLNYPEQRVITSAIVAGIVPIALGIAFGLQRQDKRGHVWCFVGDMTAQTGAFDEATRYAYTFGLPIKFVIEDNGLSVGTPTRDVCRVPVRLEPNVIHYRYKLPWPHSGAGKRVNF